MFQTKHMGSLVYAKACKAAGDDIRAMLALESMGYFDAAPGSQKYPAPFSLLYPSTGDFLAFVGNYDSRDLVRRCVKAFRAGASLPSEGGALPGSISGVGWSDHWSFWQEGWPAVMVTDTAPFRNPHYHEKSDTPDKLDYDRLGRAADGLIPVIDDLASETGP